MRLRPQYIALLGALMLAPDAGFSTPIDLCEIVPQEAVKRAKAVAILYARPAGDSIGFLARETQVTVKGCALGWCEVESTLAKGFVLDTLLVAVAEPTSSANPAPAPTRPAPRACCRVCRAGKACGNSCIARDKTCRQPAGCACNGGGDL